MNIATANPHHNPGNLYLHGNTVTLTIKNYPTQFHSR